VSADALPEMEALAAWVVVQQGLYQIKKRPKWNCVKKLAASAGQVANV